MRRFAQLSGLLILSLIMSGCGDVYRPVVIPNPPPTPDPKPAHNVFVISNNGPAHKGTGMQVNVSGDTNMGVIPLGIAPVHASLTGSGSRVLSANFLNDTVSVIAPASSLGGISKVADVVFPTGFNPSFVTTEENGAFYVAGAGASPSIAFVNGTSNVVVDIKGLPGGSGTTLSMAETSDAKKVYVASSNANSVIPVNVIDHTFNTPIAVTSPIWVSARSDGQRAYVLSQTTGAVTEINPLDDSTITNPAPINAGAGVNYMFYDARLNRLYITNPAASNVTVAGVGGDQAIQLGTLTSFPLAPRVDSIEGKHEPLACTGSVTPLTTTALPDGSRVYVAGKLVGTCTNANETVTCVEGTIGQPPSASVCFQFTVFMSNDFTVRGSVAVPHLAVTAGSAAGVCDTTRFRVTTAASADSLKVYLGSCDGGGVAVIRTDTDQFANFVFAPPSAGTSSGGGAPPPQNPVFVLPGQ
jgi:hypothetical protein